MQNQRVVIHRPGGPEALQLVTEALPQPTGRQARVKILASGVAYVDVYVRGGFVPFTSYPVTPGYDFVGVVEQVPGGSSPFKPGDLVAGIPTLGGYAQHLCIDQDRLIAVPAGLDPAEAVSVILNYTTAYRLLRDAAKLRRGDSALVHAAAGGVGTALLQLARAIGVEVFGTADTRKLGLVQELGATPIDYKHVDFVAEMERRKPGGVTAVFDAVGGMHLLRSNAVVKKGGTLVSYGITAAVQQRKRPTPSLLRTLAVFARLKLTPNAKRFVVGAIGAGKTCTSEALKADVGEMLRRLQRREITPIIAVRLPLREAARAHELLESSQVTGKIVLVQE